MPMAGLLIPNDFAQKKKKRKKLVNLQMAYVILIFGVFSSCSFLQSKNQVHRRGEYNVYSTFQSHEPEFDYLKSLEIEEKINKIRWLPQQNAAYFLLSTNGMYKCLLLLGIVRRRISHIIRFNLS